MDVNAMLGVRESYKAPTAMMELLQDDGRRVEFLNKYRQEYSDLKQEHFREYFMEAQSDRKGDKQDYTPDSIGDIISGIVGKRDSVLDIAGGIGGLTIHEWADNQSGRYVIEEISDASLPFLLFNLLVRHVNATVVHGDTLERVAKDIYTVSGDDLIKEPHTDELLAEYNLRRWVDEL